MQMAKIFKPIRWSHAARPGTAALPPFPLPADNDAVPASRVGTQPVTNTFPSGASLGPLDSIIEAPAYNEEDEGAWLALLELIFETTGWPDAE